MNPFRIRRAALGALVAAAALATPQITAQGLPAPCWEPNFGTDLQLGDDELGTNLALGFNFLLPGTSGNTTNAIDVSSNGWIGLVTGQFSSSDLSPSVSELLSDPARIATNWTDLDPSSGGAVYFNTLPASGNYPDRAVITWDQVPQYGDTAPNSIQLQLLDGGSFLIMVREQEPDEAQTILTGVSAGGGLQDPGPSDLTSPGGVQSGTAPVIYEVFGRRDLAGKAVYFLPNGGGGYIAFEVPDCRRAATFAYGSACPLPPVFYEQFAVGTGDLAGQSLQFTYNGTGWDVSPCPSSVCFDPNFSNNLALADDQLATNQTLPFSFPLPGTGGQTTSAIDVDSNGWIGLIAGQHSGSDFSESISKLLSDPPRIAAWWDDLNPSSGGGVYFDTTPNYAMVTWDQVPQFASSDANTFQVKLYANGDMTWSYVSVADDSIVGYSLGNGVVDPGAIDITAALPFSFAGFGTPMLLDSQGTTPTIGGTVTLTASNVPSGSLTAALNIGVSNTAINLSAAGAPGCSLYASTEITLPLTVSSGSGTLNLPVPGQQVLVGVQLYSQALALVPGLNALNVATTNGVELQLGN